MGWDLDGQSNGKQAISNGRQSRALFPLPPLLKAGGDFSFNLLALGT
jgi:hypothetical protein